MKSYKQVENGIITSIGKSDTIPHTATEITEEKYDQLLLKIQSCPSNTLDTMYYLSAKTEQYVGRETTHDEKVDWYASEIVQGRMKTEDVPEAYKAEAKRMSDGVQE